MILPLSALWAVSHGAFRALGFRSRLLRAGDRNVHVYDRAGRGTAPPVVLVHGLGGNAVSFLPIVRAVVARSRRVFVVELPGHGRSRLGKGEEPASIVECGQAVAGALLQIGEPAVLVGSSLGGAISLYTAALAPELVRAVVGLNPAGAPLRGKDREQVVEAFRGGSPRAALELMDRLYSRRPKSTWMFARSLGRHFGGPVVQQLVRDLREDSPGLEADVIARIKQPVLILWGEDDRLLPAASVEWFRANLPHASVEVVPKSGHLPMVETSALVAARLAAFLEELA